MAKKFKIIGVPWHVGHQYELANMDFVEQYDLLINPYRTWGTKSRPFPEKMNWVTYYEKGKYDFAILHLDQQCVNSRIGKGELYKQVNEVITDIPKIVINHMTPLHDSLPDEEVIRRVKELVGKNYMIVNTYHAKDMWGWGHPVIHGMDVNDWKSYEKEPRATIYISPAGMEKAYKREVLRNTISLLDEWGHKFYWIGIDVKFDTFEGYRDWLARSLIYLNLSHESPRPRSRTEAMLSGCCVVTNKHQDAEDFIEDGVNGFLVDEDPVQVATLVTDLLTNRCDEALKIGRNGRKYAQKHFNRGEFERQWLEVLKEVGVK